MERFVNEVVMLKGRQRFYKLTGGIIVLGFLAILVSGCVTVQMPQYVTSQDSYQESFYANYDRTLKATISTLEKTGWKISKEAHPIAFEQSEQSRDGQIKQILIFTDVRQKAMFLGSRYMTINVLVRENGQRTDVEVRYYSTLSTALKNFSSYQNDKLANKIFNLISNELEPE